MKEVIFAVSFLLLTIVCGYVFVNELGIHAINEMHEQTQKDAMIIFGNLDNNIHEANGMSLALSTLLESKKNEELSNKNPLDVDVALDACQKAIGQGVCYLMNKEGTVTSSSNRNEADSFVGKNYAFRPYFAEAMLGKSGKLFATGVTTKRSGYYASSPIRNASNEIVNVVVVKINLDTVEETLRSYHTTFLATPEGVIFLSGNPDWIGKSVVGLSPSTRQSILDKKLYGQGSFEPLFQTLPKDKMIVALNGNTFLVHVQQVMSDGWQLYVLSNVDTVEHYRLFGIITTLLFYLFLMTFITISQVIKRNAIFSFFTSAVYTSQDAIVGEDMIGKILTWNLGAEKIYGYKKEEIVGKLMTYLLPASEKEKNGIVLASIQNGRIVENFEMKHLHKNGSPIDVSLTISPIRDDDGALMGASMISRDISTIKQLEKTKSEFVSIASHQLRTPLTGIKWFSELLLHGQTGVLSKKTREYVEEISNTNQRMISLVNDLLEVSHIDDKGKYHLEQSKLDFSTIITEMVNQQRILASVNKITIDLDQNCSKKVMMNVDRTKMDQVLQNILNNAIKFSRPKGVITVSCGKKNKQLVCSIKDHGMGIPQHQQDHIFEKFFRADNSVNAGSGTGLGLYIAKNIIEQHGGKIWFESKENKGTTFYFSLPTISE